MSNEAVPAGVENAALDAVGLEIAWSQFQAVIDEGETTLLRTAFSPIIREAYDFGVVLLDASGDSVAEFPILQHGSVGIAILSPKAHPTVRAILGRLNGLDSRPRAGPSCWLDIR